MEQDMFVLHKSKTALQKNLTDHTDLYKKALQISLDNSREAVQIALK